ncbi:hypothetical protein RFI_18136 [Reticulomyxa filosa]|uniref:Periplasmic copper-binding protein NosD beta helix domain-containing protein n=1 Tax=Reticulomyxa filosa TaxID=46433 RepID=X6N195_RETFI|nr:hypothetical protein RFI_18136 [Reticulomyxa filosa]|eukprot:ETO19102.1 hypothetical protein RFI_18136 [Reticulomyxa filosa]
MIVRFLEMIAVTMLAGVSYCTQCTCYIVQTVDKTIEHISFCEGIHLYKSSDNTIQNNVANNCTRYGPDPYYTCDTAGLLLNCQCHNNIVVENQFLYGGDGIFFFKNECCPSNNNYIANNDCRYSPNNAIESTFAQGNVFANNVLNGSNYGLWLGYSHNGNVVSGNIIADCHTAGVAIEHGRDNVITENLIIGNSNGILLWTDMTVHFPSTQYQCLDIPNQQYSSNYTVTNNRIINNQVGINFVNTTYSNVYNNFVSIHNNNSITAQDLEWNIGNLWNLLEPVNMINIVGGPFIGGNYWSDYTGHMDNSGNGFGNIPYNNGFLSGEGDQLPLVVISSRNENTTNRMQIESEIIEKFNCFFSCRNVLILFTNINTSKQKNSTIQSYFQFFFYPLFIIVAKQENNRVTMQYTRKMKQQKSKIVILGVYSQ